MESAIISSIPQLGTAGAAILVLYLMYKDSSQRFAEKDQLLIEQVEKHESTMKEHQLYMREQHSQTMVQLNNATRVIEENMKLNERVVSHLDKSI
ncbi:hypothetical protein [Caudoviricetes sp.]|jgi:hypothetical protein|nr:hypothetical protein [Caudoviricetes sp.]